MSFLPPIPHDTPFPLAHLPWGVVRHRHAGVVFPVVRLGHHVMNLRVMQDSGLLDDALNGAKPFSEDTLNAFMALGRPVWRAVRARLQALFAGSDPVLAHNDALCARVCIPMEDTEPLLPMHVGDYTDFYASREHATNVGSMFRDPANALLPNWLHLPVGYHGRASSVVVSGTQVVRPKGQRKPPDGPPVFGPSVRLDFELEVGFVIGKGNALGTSIPVEEAEEHIFGLVLVNDWSARDLQQWEYVPLGPFLGKNFLTTLSPWIVSLDALEPFRTYGPAQDPTPLPYLQHDAAATFDISLDVLLQPAGGDAPARISRSNLKYLYWSMAQQIAHHTVNGCNLRPGDLLATGTISGPTPDSYGSLLELAWKGERPLSLEDGSVRTFLQDGDRLILTAVAEQGDLRIGFGEASGEIQPARP